MTQFIVVQPPSGGPLLVGVAAIRVIYERRDRAGEWIIDIGPDNDWPISREEAARVISLLAGPIHATEVK